MRDYKLRKKVKNQYVTTSALSTAYVKKGTTAVADLASGADAAAIAAKVNALLAALRTNGTIKSE